MSCVVLSRVYDGFTVGGFGDMPLFHLALSMLHVRLHSIGLLVTLAFRSTDSLIIPPGVRLWPENVQSIDREPGISTFKLSKTGTIEPSFDPVAEKMQPKPWGSFLGEKLHILLLSLILKRFASL